MQRPYLGSLCGNTKVGVFLCATATIRFSECLTKEQSVYTTEGKSLNAIEEAMRRRSHLAYD
jgi:hypothetical protein